MVVQPWCGYSFLHGPLKAGCGSGETAALPTVSTSRHGLDARSAPSCHSNSARLLFFTVELINRLLPLSSSPSFPTSGAASHLCGHGEHRSTMVSIHTIRSAMVSKLSQVFLGPYTCLPSHDSRHRARLLAYILLASQCL